MKLSDFFEQHCEGVQYDRCNGDTCKYGSEHGCTHPLFPVEEMRKEEMAKMDETDTIFERDGRTYIVNRPWWMARAYYQKENKTGKITVARCDAIRIAPPTKIRNLMLDLTEEELETFPLPVGVWSMSGGIDGERPATNHADRPITLEQVWKGYEWLQNEGEEEEEFIDRSPYQKGDAGDPYYPSE